MPNIWQRISLEGLKGTSIVDPFVTFYNAPNVEELKKNYENLPEKLEEEGVDPTIPWLYDYKIDFRFK